MCPIAALQQRFQRKKVSFESFSCIIFKCSTLHSILILNSHSFLLFSPKTVPQKYRSYLYNLASILLAIVERELVSGQGPPWSLAEFGCCGGHLSIIATSTGCYNHKKTISTSFQNNVFGSK